MKMPDKLKKMNPGTLKKLLPFLKKRWPLLALSLLLAAGTVVIQLYVPVLFGNAIDEILGEGQVRFEALSGWLLKILLFVGLSAFGTYLMNLINNRMTYGIVEGLRSKAIRHLQTLPLSYLDTHSAGDIVSRVITDIDTLSDGLLLGFTQLFSGVVTIGVTLVFMFSKNLWISLFVVLMTPLSFLVARFISSQSYKLFRKQSELRGKQTSFIDEIVSNQKVVKAFGYENRSSKRFSEINEELTECSQQAVFFSSLTNPSTRFVNNLVYAGVALFGVLLIPGGSLTVGGLSVLLSYANQYMKPFNDISSVITELQSALACASRIFDFLEVSAESRDAEGHLEKVAGQIQLSDVSFRYTKDRPLIEHFDLQVQPGMRIAIVGPTGCGKTTLINLLMRFYEVTNGRITVDGQDIRKLSRHSLRSAYGMVLQDTWIKNGTVRDNIRFGKPDASEEEILKAAKGAHCSEFIKRLPKGLDTVLNENDLSQGQKQLLCIARVMLCLPPMLILDEATSSIDTRTELEIQQAFDTLMEGRTSFVVAHRLSTIRNASLVLVMKEGKIIEKGTHEELLAAGGFYHRLYNSQFQKA